MNRYGKTVLLCLVLGWAGGCIAGPTSGGNSSAEATTVNRQAQPGVRAAQLLVKAEERLRHDDGAQASALAHQAVGLDTRWAPRARWILARALAPKDCQAALTAMAGLLADPPWIHAEKLLALKAVAYDRCGQVAEAEAIRRRIALQYPQTPEGVSAALTLLFSPEERLMRARAFENARDYDASIREARLILGGPRDREVRFFLARIELERLRENFSEAALAFATLCATEGIHQEHACYLEAKAHGRAGKIVLAIDAYTRYQIAYPRGRYVSDAVFFRAFLLYETQRFEQARKGFLSIRSGPWKDAARWYAAWCAYRLGQSAVAIKAFDALAGRSPSSRAGRRAAYWAIRTLAVSDPSAALARAKNLFSARPMDWYSILLMAHYGPQLGAFTAMRMPLTVVHEPLAPGFDEQMKEIRQLHALGLIDFARRALADLAPRIRAAGRPRIEARLAREIGDGHREHTGALAQYRSLLAGPPSANDAAAWRAMYPKAYESLVEAVAKPHGVEPHVLYSFIRKESAFNPDAISHAHAVGLMQLLPKTARAIIRRTRRISSTAQPPLNLFDPRENLELGAWYVAALKQRFRGQLPLVAAAYNAGPKAVVGWIRDAEPMATDLFVESIPFLETRRYVKQMAENVVAYDIIYGGKSLLEASKSINSTLSLRVRPGIEF